MNYQSVKIVLGRAFASTLLAALSTRAAAALLAGDKVRLSKDPLFNPQPTSVIADFTPLECDFTGYTALGYTPAWSGVVNLSPNIIGIVANVLPTCSAATAPSPNNCYGWWIDDTANVVMGERFANGAFFVFANPGDFLDLQVSLPQDLFQAAA